MRDRSKGLRIRTDVVIRRATFAAVEVLTSQTPVDTGRARYNWQVTVGAPATGTFGFPPSPESGASAALARAVTAMSAFRSANGQSVYIVNNLPYIEGLNDGSISAQGSHFVEAAMAASANVIRHGKILS